MYISASDITLPNDLYKDIMLITAPCGYGKTTYSLNPKGLLQQINEETKSNYQMKDILFLTMRRVIKEQQLKNKNTQEAQLMDSLAPWIIDENGINITTAHQYAEWIRKGKTDIIKPKIIILDEIHSLFCEPIFADSLVYVLEYLRENWNDLIKIGLTATPAFLLWHIAEYADKDFSFSVIDRPLAPKYRAKNLTVNIGSSVRTVLDHLPIDNNHKALVYMRSARRCYKYAQEYENADFLISRYNETEIETESGKTRLADIMLSRSSLSTVIEREVFPQNINILFVNSAYREGMNISDESVKYIICEAIDMITIEQLIGRIRANTENIYIIANRLYESQAIADYEEYKSITDLEQRYIAQLRNASLRKWVYMYKEELKLNVYARGYLRYISECYIQYTNRENNHKYYIDHPQIAQSIKEYFSKLQIYSENELKIEYSFATADALAKDNALTRLSKSKSNWLNRPLRKRDKDELCAFLGVMRSNGKKANWNTVRELLENNGYIVRDCRNNKERWSVIEEKEY